MTIEEKVQTYSSEAELCDYDGDIYLEDVVRLNDVVMLIKQACDKQKEICYRKARPYFKPLKEHEALALKAITDAPYPEFEEE